jgi:SAM-dependent methyltransferase
MNKNKLPSWAYRTCPALSRGPIARSASLMLGAFLEARQGLSAAEDMLLRSFLTYRIYHMRERLFALPGNPLPGCNKYFKELATLIPLWRRAANDKAYPLCAISRDLEEFTGKHYGGLFAGFSAKRYVDEASDLLRARFSRNHVSIKNAGRKIALDAGCGGGRYAFALARMGFRQVVGLDFSDQNIATCASRKKELGAKNISFRKGSVLRMPLKSGAFDFVFSNGVLHHTKDWQKGISEMLRVMKPGGEGWLYVILSPGGLFWELCEVMRGIMRGGDSCFARDFMRLMGCPPNRVFNILDHVMVPINLLLKKDSVTQCLRQNGATDIRFLVRGADADDAEQLYQKAPFAKLKYALSEGRFVFKKTSAQD